MIGLPRSRTRARSVLAIDRARFERGAPFEAPPPRVAVVAHWSARSRVTRSACALVRELQACSYRVVVCSTCEAAGELGWDDAVDTESLVVIRRPNVGYDFGSWSVALSLVPAAARAEHVVLANDSMAGPFSPLRPLLLEYERTPADVWGITDSSQYAPHLQSYFLGFRGGVLAEDPLQGFWSSVGDEAGKQEIILRHEIGLSALLREEGYIQTSAIPHESLVRPGHNPVIVGWELLLQRGFPFVKREILRRPSIAPRGATAPAVVGATFGIDLTEWVDDLPGAARATTAP